MRVWDLETGQTLRKLEGHTGLVTSVAITPNGRCAMLASGGLEGGDRTLREWDLESGQMRRAFEGHRGGVWAAAITPDGRRAISASRDGTLRAWDLVSGQCCIRSKAIRTGSKP